MNQQELLNEHDATVEGYEAYEEASWREGYLSPADALMSIYRIRRVQEFAVHKDAELILKELRAEILNRCTNLPIIERCADPLDEAIALQATCRVADDRDRDAKRLREIAMGLEAIADGTYGTCSTCDASIAMRRMIAVPWALQCIQCANNEEARIK